MEVHAHSHTHPGRKKWTHYFWEFLMLFLAVYLGFLAENWREHRVENHRAHRYVETFYEDLKIDTARLNFLSSFETNKIKSLSSYKNCYDSLLNNQHPVSLVEILKNIGSNNPFRAEDRTIRQLTNAGGYRLLKQEDADSISSYNTQCILNDGYQNTIYQQAQDDLRSLLNTIVDLDGYSTLFGDMPNTSNMTANESKLPLFETGDKVLLKKFFNTLFHYLRVTVQHKNRLIRLKGRADRLLEYFNAKYHFE